jgi:hypothetical protein
VTGGANSIEKAVVEGGTFGRCKLVGTQEILPGNEFHAIAEVTQDPTVDGFLNFLPENTVDIITAIAEGTTPHLETDAVYSEKKVKAKQIRGVKRSSLPSTTWWSQRIQTRNGDPQEEIFEHRYAISLAAC